MEIKKIIKEIYSLNLDRAGLSDKNEIVHSDTIDEFSQTFRRIDSINGIIVQPSGYKKGLFYSLHTNEIFNEPSLTPNIVKFNLEFIGLKKGTYYKLTVQSRNYKEYMRLTDTTSDRHLNVITSNNDLLINQDLTNVMKTEGFSGVFKAYSNDTTLSFTFGKIAIKNIIVEEIELMQDEVDENVTIIETDREIVISSAVFMLENNNSLKGNWTPLLKLFGKGINMYYNKITQEYSIERDNIDDVINENLNSNSITIDINTNKIPDENVMGYVIKKCDNDLSYNTLKTGNFTIQFIDRMGNIYSPSNGRISIKVHKLI